MKKRTETVFRVCATAMLIAAISALGIYIGLDNRVEKTVYDEKEIVSILYYSIDGFGKGNSYKLYDFEKMNYSEKSWSEHEYEVQSTFTQAKADMFFKNIRAHGIFMLKRAYKTDEIIMDGGSSYLVITFRDETTMESSFYHKYPKEAKKLNRDFVALTGTGLFLSLA